MYAAKRRRGHQISDLRGHFPGREGEIEMSEREGRGGEGGGVWRNRSRSSWGLSLSVCLSLSLRVCVEGQQAGYGFPISCLAIKIQGTSRATRGSSLEIHKRDPASKFIHLDGEAHK